MNNKTMSFFHLLEKAPIGVYVVTTTLVHWRNIWLHKVKMATAWRNDRDHKL